MLLDGIGHYPQMEAPADVMREYLALADGVAQRDGLL